MTNGEVLDWRRPQWNLSIMEMDPPLSRTRNLMSILHVVTDVNDEDVDDDLNATEISQYRRWAAQLNYVALDNPVIAYAVKEVSRRMNKPVKLDFSRIERILKFLNKGRF